MSRRTVLLAAMVALTGCQGPNSTTTSAFKFPTPSLNLLAPYGPPRIPPPATYSYGQSGLAPPAAASNYYPGAVNARGVSLPQSMESESQSAPATQGKVAQAVWKSTRPPMNGDGIAEGEPSLIVREASGQIVVAENPATGDGAIRIPETSTSPAEPATLVLGGMPAHDLTKAMPREHLASGGIVAGVPTTMLASASLVPRATQVVYTAPPVIQATVAAPATTAGDAAPANELTEITDLPQAAAPAGNRTLQRVRGYETPKATTPPVENFISPEVTISATALEARDVVAAAAVEGEPTIVKPVSPGSSPGWKSRYLSDES